MSKYFILYEGSLFNIDLKNNTLEYIDVLTNNIQEITKNGICLLGGNESQGSDGHYFFNSKEYKLSLDDSIKKMASSLQALSLDDISYVKETIVNEEHESEEFFFYAKKSDIERIFRLYEFQSIYPLDYILYKTSETEEIKGLCTSALFYMKQFKNLSSLVNSTNFFAKKNFDVDFNINDYLSVDNEKPKLFIIGKDQLDKVEDSIKNELIIQNFEYLVEQIQEIEDFYFKDKYSLYYQSKKLKPYIILFNIPLLIIGGWLYFQYIQKTVNTTFYQTKINEYTQKIKKTKDIITTNKKKDVKVFYQPIGLEYLTTISDIITKVDANNKLVYPNIKLYDLSINNIKNKEILLKIITTNKETIRKLAVDYKGSYTNLLFKDDGKEFEIILKLEVKG